MYVLETSVLTGVVCCFRHHIIPTSSAKHSSPAGAFIVPVSPSGFRVLLPSVCCYCSARFLRLSSHASTHVATRIASHHTPSAPSPPPPSLSPNAIPPNPHTPTKTNPSLPPPGNRHAPADLALPHPLPHQRPKIHHAALRIRHATRLSPGLEKSAPTRPIRSARAGRRASESRGGREGDQRARLVFKTPIFAADDSGFV